MGKRIVVCVDFDDDGMSLVDCYQAVYEGMGKSGLDWESSDEWFDDDGMEGKPEVLQAARMVAHEGRGRDLADELRSEYGWVVSPPE